MKVAFIVWQFPLLSETFIVNQAQGLLEQGHEVDILAERPGNTALVHPIVAEYHLLNRTAYFTTIPDNWLRRVWDGWGLLLSQGIPIKTDYLRALNPVQYGLQALSLWTLYSVLPEPRGPYDIIHCQFGTQAFRGRAFRDLYSPDAKFVVTFRGHDISSFIQMRGIHVYDRIFEVGDKFLTNCDYFRDRLLQLGCPAHRSEVLRSGLKCERFLFNFQPWNRRDPLQLFTTGRLVEKKGIEYVIRALSLLPELDITYSIIGDGPLRSSLETLAETLGVRAKVRFLGQHTEQMIITYLRQAHLFIAPSVTAQDGNQDAPINVLKEAMALGIPVISTYHGGIPELVENGVSGLLVPEKDPEAIAQTIRQLVDHTDLWLPMAQAGRLKVETDYDLHQLNQRLEHIYQELVTDSDCQR